MNRSIPKNGETARETWLLRGHLTKGVLLIAAILIVLFMTWLVFIYTNETADQLVFDHIRPYITPGLTRFMRKLTLLANAQFLVPINVLLVIYFLIRKRKWLALRVGVLSLGGLLIKLGLKQLFHRLRPADPVIEGGVPGYSFPSGHALLGVCFYGFLIWWVAISVRNKWKQGILIGLLLLTILTVSFSRIYLRVHYMTDILAGLSLGFVWLVFALWQIDRIEMRYLARRKEPAETRSV